MVDYTDFEEKDCERKKEKCMFSPLHHHHRPTTERRTIKKNFRGGFLNFIKQNYTERRKTERKKEFKLTPLDHHRASTTERRNFFFREILIIIIFIEGGYIINIYKYKY